MKAIEILAGAIKERPEAATAGIAILTPAVLIPLGVNEWAALMTPLAIYLVYCVRTAISERNAVKLAERQVELAQIEGDQRITDLAEKYLERLPRSNENGER